MQHMKIAGACALTVMMLCSPAAAQITIMPGGVDGGPLRMPPGREMKTGTGRIKGRVITADTGAPVRRAQVRVTGTDIMPKIATTDNDGSYEIKDLPAGRFTVTVTKSGFVNVGYGQRRPFEAPRPIELGEAQALDKADIVMPRGSAINGRITDEFGEPIADVVVTAMRSTWQNGRRRLQSAGRTATTNDLGQYRIYGLPPGEYYVSASLRGAQEMVVAEMAVMATVVGGPQPDSPRSGYSPTYYPGTPNGNEAQKLAVAIGQEAQNIDFGLVGVRLVRVSGQVIGSDGRPMEGISVSTAPRSAADAGFLTLPGGSGRTDKNGNFTLNGVAPGDYTLNARGSTVMSSGDGDRMVFTMTRVVGGPGGDGQNEFGSVPLTVGAEDVSNVVIVTSKGATVQGRLVWEGGNKPTANTVRITAASADGEPGLAMLGGSGSVTAEGTFELKGLAGQRLFRVANVPAGWVLKAVTANGQDVTDTGLDIKGTETITNLEVVLTNRLTELAGTVKAGNEPALDYTVVIFSDDPQKWTVPQTRHIVSARPSQDGKFQLKNLPAGGYYAVALEYIPQGDWFDPEVLERLRSKASRFTLEDGGKELLDLRLESM
jgi:protocatechuate 3,4-dioxygenase beta subunit